MPEKMTDRKRKTKRSKFSSEESDSNSVSSSSSSSSADEETDIKDLKPIKEYLPNRKELASQLFKSVKAEKIRMMLPQTLKKIEFNDLEELCAAELTGMSKTRIMCIINGQEMLQSSDTEESIDSGPSLEIISDTEWLSEAEPNVKIEGANSKSNKENKKSKKKSQDQKKLDPKSKLNLKPKGKLGKDGKPNLKVKLEKVKTEVKEKEKEKEGESLLDLLELEMRARAIRALIRKEEDSSNTNSNKAPNNSTSSTAASSNDSSTKSRQANLKEQLEKIDVLMKHGDDEDVFVVINPAPTIELLSSESENEEHSKRVNQKFVSERKSNKKNEKAQEKSQPDNSKENEILEDKVINVEKDLNNKKNSNKEKAVNKENNKEKVANKENNEGENTMDSNNANKDELENITSSNKNNKQIKVTESSKEDLEDGEIIDEEDDSITEENKVTNKSKTKKIDTKSKILHTMENENENEEDNGNFTIDESETGNEILATCAIKKVKKNPNIRIREKESNDGAEFNKIKSLKKINKENDYGKNKIHLLFDEPIEIEESPEREELKVDETLNTNGSELDSNSKIDLSDDKLLDIEEVINLDDYPDDMDDLEKIESSKPADKSSKEKDKAITDTAPSRSETWATRYYQQDEVQNVIKESKIQSEIRKRLRERQRQSKLNNSPKFKEQEESQPNPEPSISKPTGSVEEYLALKQLCKETSNNVPVQNVENTEQPVYSNTLSDNLDNISEKNDPHSINDVIDEIKEESCAQDKSFGQPINTKKNKKNKKLSKKIVQKPVVIKKKPKLLKNASIVRKVDPGLNENIALQLLNKVIRCDTSFESKNECSIEQNNSFTNDEKSLVKDDSLQHEKSYEQIVQTNLINDLAQSDKNIVVVEDNLSVECGKINTKIVEEGIEVISHSKTSSLKDNNLHQSIENHDTTLKKVIIEDVSSCSSKNEPYNVGKKLNENSCKSEKLEEREIESLNSKKDSSPLRDDESVSKSDSSDDNIIVRIDNSNNISDKKRQHETTPEANKRMRQMASSESENSELRPD